jgi:4-hydroxybenzoate polyprenyltransferase
MIAGLWRTMRPHQWVKNLFVLTPIVFARRLLEPDTALHALAGFFAFCMAASAVYFVNDLIDLESDRRHPVKRNRPIASGELPESTAKAAAALLAMIAVGIGTFLDIRLTGTLGIYLLLNVLYGFRLKRVPYVDVVCIAGGFELRVLAGAVAAGVPASKYLLVVTFLLALFLGLGKRMHELMLGEQAHRQRSVLKEYRKTPLSALLMVTATATIATYAAYTLDPQTRMDFGTDRLVWTTPFALIGILRFLKLVRDRPSAESPTEEMLRDVPFLANLAFWAVSIVIVIYYLK